MVWLDKNFVDSCFWEFLAIEAVLLISTLQDHLPLLLSVEFSPP
jgi:hypothetical protein